MATQYTVKQTAAILGTSTATVRRMADEFASALPDFQPVAGKVRTFSESDVRTLHALFTRVQASPGLTRSALLSELSAPGSEPLIIPATLPTAKPASPQDGPGRAIGPQPIQTDVIASQTAIQAFADVRTDVHRMIEPLSALPSALDSLSARVESLERSQSAQDGPGRAIVTPLIASALISVGVLIVSLTVSALTQWAVAGVAGSALALFVLIVGLVAPSMRR